MLTYTQAHMDFIYDRGKVVTVIHPAAVNKVLFVIKTARPKSFSFYRCLSQQSSLRSHGDVNDDDDAVWAEHRSVAAAGLRSHSLSHIQRLSVER